MLLVDTTVWIDFFADKDTQEVDYLTHAISESRSICICGVILTELLQGISRPKEYKTVLDLMSNLIYLPMTQKVFIEAAEIYRKLRKQGISIRKTIDCIIAATAIEHSISLLHHDRDFKPIEKYCGLKVINLKNS